MYDNIYNSITLKLNTDICIALHLPPGSWILWKQKQNNHVYLEGIKHMIKALGVKEVDKGGVKVPQIPC